MASKNKQLALNMISQIIVFIVQVGITFKLTPFIVSSLGIDSYGFVGLSNNIIGYMQVATVALNSMAGRFITIEYHKGNIEKANKYFSSVFYANFFIGLILLVVSVGLLYYLEYILTIPESLNADVKWLFAILCINSVLLLIFNVYTVAPFIKNRIEITAMRNLFSNLIRAAILLILFGFCGSHLWYMGCSALLCSVYLCIANFSIKNKLTPELGVDRKNFDYTCVKELLQSGAWNLIGKLGDILQRGCDLLFANWFISAAAMGILSITTQIPFMILSVFAMLSSSFAPSMTKEFALGNLDAFFKDVQSSIRILSILTIIPISALYVYGDIFYQLWMPGQDAVLLQQLTIVGTFALIVTQPLDSFWNIFTITNKIKGSSLFMIANSIVVFVTVLVCLIFTDDIVTKMFIIAGVRSCYGVLRGLFFLPIYGACCLNQTWSYFYKSLAKPLIGLTVTLALLFLLRLIYIPDTWLTFLLMTLVVMVVSILIGSIFILTKQDRHKLRLKLVSIYDKHKK